MPTAATLTPHRPIPRPWPLPRSRRASAIWPRRRSPPRQGPPTMPPPRTQDRPPPSPRPPGRRSEEHTSELQSRGHLVCRLLLEKKKQSYSDVEQRATDE